MSTASLPHHQRAVSLNGGVEAQQTLLKRRDNVSVDHAELLEDDLNAIGFGAYRRSSAGDERYRELTRRI